MPKQYVKLAEKTVLERTIDAFRSALPNASIQIVIGEDDIQNYRDAVAGLPPLPEPVVGGSSRQESVFLGLDAVRPQSPVS